MRKKLPVPSRRRGQTDHAAHPGRAHQLPLQPHGHRAGAGTHARPGRTGPHDRFRRDLSRPDYGDAEEHSILEYTDNAVVIGGFSKAYAMTGWRLGYACGPEPIMNGRIYKEAPVPKGGTHAALARTVSTTLARIVFREGGHFQARAVFAIRSAFMSGRNVTMRPSFVV